MLVEILNDWRIALLLKGEPRAQSFWLLIWGFNEQKFKKKGGEKNEKKRIYAH
jgi:hypothetical protein